VIVMMRSMLPYIGIAGILFCLLSCRDRDREGREVERALGEGKQTTVTGADLLSVANATAVNRIADARCAREVHCRKVGTGKAYETTDLCAEKIRGDIRGDLSATVCPNGVSSRQLEACVAAIRGESCASEVDKMDHLVVCEAGNLCFR
jgi:hypothetical protein